MPAKRKASDTLALPAPAKSVKPPTQFLIKDANALITTNKITNGNGISTKPFASVIDIPSSSSSSDYEDADEDGDEYENENEGDEDDDEEDGRGSQSVNGGDDVHTKPQNGDGDVEMKDGEADAVPEENGHKSDQEQNGGPSFGELIRAAEDPILVSMTSLGDFKSTGAMKPLDAPNLASLGTVLNQALRTDDNHLLESCLRVSEISTVRSTLQRLDSSLVGILLSKLAARLHRRPGRAASLQPWMQCTIVCHGGALAKDPTAIRALRELHEVLTQRAEGLNLLLMLKGKLDMVDAQRANLRSLAKRRSSREKAVDNDEDVVFIVGQEDAREEQNVPIINGWGNNDEDSDSDSDEEYESAPEVEVAVETDVDLEGDEDDFGLDGDVKVGNEEEEDDDEDEDDSDIGEAAAAPPPSKLRKIQGSVSGAA